MQASAGGGGEGIVHDPAAMADAVGALEGAAARLDGSGSGIPSVGDVGDAAALVALVVAAYADAGARVSAEALTIAGAVEACRAGMQHADAQQAVDLLRTGRP